MTGAGPEETQFFLFQDTTEVLWAEEVAQMEGIPVDVVPAPVESDDLCGLAIVTPRLRAPELEALLHGEGIPFSMHPTQ